MTVTIPRMTEEEIQQLVMGVVKGSVFAGSQVPPEMLAQVFMPLLFLEAEDGIDWDNLGNVVEDMSKAGAMAVNGYPTFLSCRLIHKDDWAVVAERANVVQATLEQVVKGLPPRV